MTAGQSAVPSSTGRNDSSEPTPSPSPPTGATPCRGGQGRHGPAVAAARVAAGQARRSPPPAGRVTAKRGQGPRERSRAGGPAFVRGVPLTTSPRFFRSAHTPSQAVHGEGSASDLLQGAGRRFRNLPRLLTAAWR